MQGVALLVALSTLGVDQTWRQTEDGQVVEYVLQIEPVWLSALAEGKAITGQLPPELTRVDRVCIRVGSNLRTLAKTAPDFPELIEGPERLAAGAPPPDAPLAVYAKPNGDLYESYSVIHGWQPATDKETTYLIQLAPDLLEMLKEGDEIYAAILPEAGEVGGFMITSGRDPVPRKAARPPVVAATQLQDPPRTSSPAADVPPTSDFTGGDIYSGTGTTDAAGNATAPGNAGTFPTPVLQPPARGDNEVPAFDRSQFERRSPAASGTARTGSSRTTTGTPAGRLPAPRQSAEQPGDAGYLAEEDQAPRMASRLTGTSRLDQEQMPRRVVEPSTSQPAEKRPEFPGWMSLLIFCALCLSLGGNVYMIWTAAEYYHRYKLAIERLRSAGRS